MSYDIYDRDYFENGPQAGVSCYSNYRWLPEKTLMVVMAYIDYLNIPRGASVLDFGCAKGYYVKAFRMLAREAWGCDVSKYALGESDNDTGPFLEECGPEENVIPFDRTFNYIISKDVLEHLEIDQVVNFLESAKTCKPRKLFIIVPLASKGKYVIPEDELDITHKIRLDKQGWIELLTSTGWLLDNFTYRIEGIKDHQSVYRQGVGFFTLTLGV
jgi:SAM-dependent methyltransferase